ncbi:hypothetical protein [Caballeronia telluris]|uniref:Uncharacterized protein n=1 Tax=Caballeronia telluris TaxID=326475 RepID=A0A158JZ30_9BURK|nr:hypothetical protein [Caballeronia telluris]SAL73995.1 hypothetical protein AWB66_04930 [Caballeronia telluris]
MKLQLRRFTAALIPGILLGFATTCAYASYSEQWLTPGQLRKEETAHPHHATPAIPEQDPFTLQSTSDPLTNQMQHFCDVIRGTAKPLLDARGAAKTLAATLAVKEAAATGRVVTLS